jgi:hypothetical protein
MFALGRLFDISAGLTPVNMATAANTGKRVSLRNASGITIVVFKGAGTAGEDPVMTLKQHTAASSGTTADLVAIDRYWVKQEATLDGDETWSKVTQTAAAAVTGNGTSAEEEAIYVFQVDAASLSDGYTHVSLDIADVGTGAQLGSILYILHDLEVQRTPENLANPQA